MLKLYKKSINCLRTPVRWNVGTDPNAVKPSHQALLSQILFFALPTQCPLPPLLQIVPPSMRPGEEARDAFGKTLISA